MLRLRGAVSLLRGVANVSPGIHTDAVLRHATLLLKSRMAAAMSSSLGSWPRTLRDVGPAHRERGAGMCRLTSSLNSNTSADDACDHA